MLTWRWGGSGRLPQPPADLGEAERQARQQAPALAAQAAAAAAAEAAQTQPLMQVPALS
jgi:hypothetical protein